MSEEEMVELVAAVMAKQCVLRAGLINAERYPTDFWINNTKRSAPKVYLEILEDAAAILSALDKAGALC